MTLMQVLEPQGRQLLYPQGRTPRLWFWLAIFTVAIVLQEAGRPIAGLGLPGQIAQALLRIFEFYLFSSIVVGRLHDHDRSGWWALLIQGPPACLQLLDLAGLVSITEIVSSIYFIVSAVLWGLPQVIYLGFLRGTIGPNRFGDDPLMNGDR